MRRLLHSAVRNLKAKQMQSNQKKGPGLRVRVKLGMLSIADAMNLCAPSCKTYGWLKRRLANAAKDGGAK